MRYGATLSRNAQSDRFDAQLDREGDSNTVRQVSVDVAFFGEFG
jgi:hypothetical protein